MEDGNLLISLGGIVLTAILTTIGTWLVTRYSIRRESEANAAARNEELDRHARYLAIRVVSTLDPFVLECVEVVHDGGTKDLNGVMEPQVATPKLALPNDVDWRAVRPDLMYRILGFPNEIAMADQAISWTVNVVAGPPGYDEYFQERIIQYGRLGLTALILANDLRNVYGIPARESVDWNPGDVLKDGVAAAEKERAEDVAKQAEFVRDMMERHNAAQAVSINREAEKNS